MAAEQQRALDSRALEVATTAATEIRAHVEVCREDSRRAHEDRMAFRNEVREMFDIVHKRITSVKRFLVQVAWALVGALFTIIGALAWLALKLSKLIPQ